ncbi:MAG: ribonuclease HII [Clostridia bacterium]|nr:ribonuclease HII [Clostridia bacterium]
MKKDWNARLVEISQTDREIWETGRVFAGIDEAGRGPLCGPVAAACVVMPKEPLLLYVEDSKKLSEKRREALYDQILETAVYAQVILASPEEIDRVNILNATKNAMALAAKDAPCDLFLVDAIDRLDVPGEVRGIVHGDALCYSIAAASILAKVTRDRLMRELDETYPQYGFAKNKGYGTAQHIAALKEYGPCPAHRRSFIGNFVKP